MMALIFLILLVAVLMAWTGHRSPALYCFAFTMVLAVIWLFHHITSSLALQL